MPIVFPDYFEENKRIHQHDTRQKDNFHQYTVESETGKRAVKYKGTKLWNSLPDDIKNTLSPTSFKYKLKNYLLQSL